MDFCASDRAAYEKLLEDAPFELPKGWMWCRLGEIAEVQLGKMLDRKKTNGTPLPYLANVSVRWGEFDLLALKTMPFSECEKEKFALRPGDILMCEGGVPGRCAIWREPDSIIKYQKALHRIRLKTVSAEYIRYFFEAIHDTMFFTKRFSGSTIHHLPREVLIQVPIPLPPLTEQKRIVASIEELFKIADRLGEAADGLETAAKHLDKKILDLAIRGKLLPQNPEDEPASELLKRIAATSHKSPCKNHGTETETTFEIPCGWTWCRLDEISLSIGNKNNQILVKEIRETGKWAVVSQGQNLIDGYSDFDEKAIEDLPIILFGDHTRNVKYLDFPFIVGADGAKLLKPLVEGKWLYYWMFYGASKIRNRGYARHWNEISKLPVPLPPIAEQKRIVAKIEELRKATQALTM